jgi:hypothetical protein
MEPVAARIITHAQALPEGAPIVSRGLLHLGSRAAVDKALSRLAAGGQFARVARGIYVRRITSRFGTRSPAVGLFMEAFAAQSGEMIVPSGVSAANRLGLSTQIPAVATYLTSGRTHRFRFGNMLVEVRHAPRWLTALGNEPAGEIVRAMAWLGPERAAYVVRGLRGRIEEQTRVQLLTVQSQLPEWMARSVEELANG